MQISFEVSTRACLDLLRQNNEKNIEVLQYLGCLPSGISDNDLTTMLDGRDIRDSLEKLDELAFLEKQKPRKQGSQN